MLRDLRGWPTPAPILAAAAALDFGVVTYMIVRRLHPPPPGSRAPPQVTRRMAAAVLGDQDNLCVTGDPGALVVPACERLVAASPVRPVLGVAGPGGTRPRGEAGAALQDRH